jgi:tight adherence protein C
MEFLLDLLGGGDGDMSLVLAIPVFVAAAAAALGVMAIIRTRESVRRRAAGIGSSNADRAETSKAKSSSGARAVQRLIEKTSKHYASTDGENMKRLRQRLIQAAIFDPRAVGMFFLLRIALALGLAGTISVVLPMFTDKPGSMYWALVMTGGIFGYFAPSIGLNKLIKKRRQEYRSGFPDFMDLLVVCADAGLAMEASLERVGRELAPSYPRLSANIHMTNLEIRAGRTLTDALEHFAERLGLEEVRSFALLIQQSDELGSSITEALRVYSEDMRHKRLSAAEEKAYALPAKLSLPLMICVFPVLFVVILLPVVVRFKMGAY